MGKINLKAGRLIMKKIFAILMTVCLMVSVLSVSAVTAFAADETADKLPDPAADVVLRVKAKDKKSLNLSKR